MNRRILAIVPARAGSKRLPKKNTKLLSGIPLVAHTFEAIKRSKYITTTVASSDCPEVLDISSRYENTLQLNRPQELASDTATMIDVVLHAIYYAEQTSNFDIICILQPTSPLRTGKDIDKAIELYLEKEAKGVVSLAKCQHSPLWATPLETITEFKVFMKGLSDTRSQDLKPFYQLNGAIYLIDKDFLINSKKLFSESDFYPFIMEAENSIDIDNLIDFRLAELMLEERRNGSDC